MECLCPTSEKKRCAHKKQKKEANVEKRTNTKTGVLGISVAILFIVAVLTFPYAFNLSWALPGASADRTLTYTTGNLTWDSATDIDESGAIHLDLFKSSYEGASATSADGENIVAPNTSNSKDVRLKNDTGNEIEYSAVLYRLDNSTSTIQAEVVGGAAATDYVLPEGVSQDKVVNAIGGTVQGNNTQIMAIDWAWDLYVNDENDVADTSAGNDGENQNVGYGLYVVVVEPDPEPTPDDGNTNKNENTNTNTNDNTNGNTNREDKKDEIIDNINNIINKYENEDRNINTDGITGLFNKNNTNTKNNASTIGTFKSNTNTNTKTANSKVVAPTTGDNSQFALLFALALACCCAMVAIILQKSVKRERKATVAKSETQQNTH